MSISAIGSAATQSYRPVTTASPTAEVAGEQEHDGDADDGATPVAAAAPTGSSLAPGVGKIVDQHA